MNHVHHDLIVAWAKGAQVEFFDQEDGKWYDSVHPVWLTNAIYRIKPETKPDVVLYGWIGRNMHDWASIKPVRADAFLTKSDNCMFVFDGETGKLKDAQVLASSNK